MRLSLLRAYKRKDGRLGEWNNWEKWCGRIHSPYFEVVSWNMFCFPEVNAGIYVDNVSLHFTQHSREKQITQFVRFEYLTPEIMMTTKRDAM